MSTHKPAILLAEPAVETAAAIEQMLAGCPRIPAGVRRVQTLAEALRELANHTFQVVLYSLGVSDGAGLGSLPLLRAASPGITLIVLSKEVHNTIYREAMAAAADDCLFQPDLTPALLDRVICHCLERHRLQMALLASEEKYHTLFDHLVEGLFQTTPEGRYLLANAALARIYGYASPDELIECLTDIGAKLYVQPGRREEFARLLAKEDTLKGFESEVYRKDGSIIWISENCRAIRDCHGKLLYYEGTVQDITSRKQAEQNLRESEALYHSLVETLPQNIFRKDLQGRFTFANQQFCRSLGRSLREIVGKTDFAFFPEQLASKYQEDDRRVLGTGKPYETVEEHRPPGSDTTLYVQVVKTPLYGSDGQLIGLQGIFWDITEQRLAEEKIRKTNALLAQSRRELSLRNQQMQDDLHMAREIQLTMLPQQYPSFPRTPGATESAFTFTHRYLPSGSVGGDFFSISALSETQAGIFICDVAGHGVRSALVTAMVRAIVEELKPVAIDPGEFLSRLNTDLHAILKHTGSPLLTTAFYVVADWERGLMRYANAGHPQPLHLRRKSRQVSILTNQGGKPQPALGLFEKSLYEVTERSLEPGDMVMLFTDGLYEVQNGKDQLFTKEMLLAAVKGRLREPANVIFDRLLQQVRKFAEAGQFTDDVCLVAVEVNT